MWRRRAEPPSCNNSPDRQPPGPSRAAKQSTQQLENHPSQGSRKRSRWQKKKEQAEQIGFSFGHAAQSVTIPFDNEKSLPNVSLISDLGYYADCKNCFRPMQRQFISCCEI